MSHGALTDMAWAHEDVQEIVERSGTSFFWAMRLLPQDRRQAIFAVYAFCREVDDIADGDMERGHKHTALDIWRGQIDDLFNADIEFDKTMPNAAILTILKEAISLYGLSKADFIAIIDGMQMDIDGPIIAPSMQELELYCDRVASAV
ncbi:MAG: squalene/phytoene synthase family protein, partial [Litorimonas sp.]